MYELGEIIVKRSIKVIIMLIPSLLWGSLVMFDICFGVAHSIFLILSYLIIALLCFTMLFLNTFLNVYFAKDMFENLQCRWRKPNKNELFYGFITGLPLVFILFLAPIWLFLVYGMIQFFYILADPDHMSIMERCYGLASIVIKVIKQKIEIRKQKKIEHIKTTKNQGVRNKM